MVVVLFVLVLIVFSLAQEQSRVMERVYTGKWDLRATNNEQPVKNTPAQIAGPIRRAQHTSD